MNLDFFETLINQKLLATHTCYLAKVLSVDGNQARIQPLSLVKAVNSTPKRQAVINNVPICKHALEGVVEGSTAVVACMERDITQTRNGIFALPSLRRHSLSDSIIIGVL